MVPSQLNSRLGVINPGLTLKYEITWDPEPVEAPTVTGLEGAARQAPAGPQSCSARKRLHESCRASGVCGLATGPLYLGAPAVRTWMVPPVIIHFCEDFPWNLPSSYRGTSICGNPHIMVMLKRNWMQLTPLHEIGSLSFDQSDETHHDCFCPNFKGCYRPCDCWTNPSFHWIPPLLRSASKCQPETLFLDSPKLMNPRLFQETHPQKTRSWIASGKLT